MMRGSSRSVLFGGCLALAGAIGVSCEQRTQSGQGGPKIRRIGVVAREPTTDFWEAVHTGANAAIRGGRDVLLDYRGPGVDGDAPMQAAVVRDLVAAKVDALVIGPVDDTTLAEPLAEARSARIPVVIVDREVAVQPGDGITGLVATDDLRAGAVAAQRLAETMQRGLVLLFRYDKAEPNTTLREQGFATEMSKVPALTLADPRFYSGKTLAEARKAADSLLAEQPDVKAVFCPNEVSAHGMVLALRERFMNGKVKVIAFGTSLFLVEALALGDIEALVVPDPVAIGRASVQAAIDTLDGKPVPARQDIAAALATRANMHEDVVKRLLNPDVTPPGQ